MIKDKLQIVLVTYNRKDFLEKTLNQLFLETSPIKDFDITILNNDSTDGSTELINDFCTRHNNLTHIQNKINIGGNANILRAIEYATKKYIWILADDDTYDFSECDDVIEKICNDDFALIHVDGHKDVFWPQIKYRNVDDAIKGGYPYFKI